MSWRYIGASITGTSHAKTATPCQDTHVVRCIESGNGDVFWAILSDGAGSAKFGELGAQVTCNGYANRIERWLIGRDGDLKELDLIVIQKWAEMLRKQLDDLTKRNGHRLRDYACTLLGIVVGKNRAVCFQIGDGGIVISHPAQGYRIVFWPENGEYVNTTRFLTDETPIENLSVEIIPYVPKDIALFTDGIQRLALQFSSRSVFTPFFTPMFQRLSAESPGHSWQLESDLEAFLDSKQINERTDDDKTLVLATYRESENSIVSTDK